MTTQKIIYYGLLVLCLVTLFLQYKKLGKLYRWFIPLIALAIGTQVAGDIVKKNGYSHYFVFHIYQPIEFTFLSLYYYYLFDNVLVKKVIALSIPLFIVVHIIYYSTRFYDLDFTDFTIQAILIFIWCMIYFINLFRKEQYIVLSRDTNFWLNTANILFYTGCVMVMGIAKYFLSNDEELRHRIFGINNFLNLLLYFLYCIAFLCLERPKKYRLS